MLYISIIYSEVWDTTTTLQKCFVVSLSTFYNTIIKLLLLLLSLATIKQTMRAIKNAYLSS